jgi:hypothetical protein
MKIRVNLMLEEKDAPNASFTLQTKNGPVTLTAEKGQQVIEVTADKPETKNNE